MIGRARRAADLLERARAGGPRPERLPDDCRPRSAAEAYAIQDAILERRGPAAGWKVGAKAPDAEPACAPLLAETIHASPAALPGRAFGTRGIEAELAVRLGRDLPTRDAPYRRDEVLDAIDALLPAIEVVDGRFRNRAAVDRLAQLADNLSSGAFVAGRPVIRWREIEPLRQPVRLEVDGAVRAEATGGNPAGDPLRLVVWLANALSRRGVGLAAGSVVTTGSCTGMVFVEPGAVVAAAFPGLGQVRLRFT